MSWDPFQREVLAALGVRVYVPAGAGRGEPAGVPMAVHEAPAADAAPARVRASVRRDDAALLAALAKAAGVTVEALPPLDPQALRSPAAKRALWPTLRTLRRARH